MASLIRLFVGLPIAAVITFLLFMLMQRLILTDEVVIEEAGDELRISISEEVEDLQVRQREVTMDETKRKADEEKNGWIDRKHSNKKRP